MITLKTHIKRFGYLAIGLFLLTACRPKGILSSKQMEDIFVDLHTADGILQVAGYNYGHNETLKAYYQVILEEHGTTQAQFDSSLVWYTANPTIFDKIYPKVVDRLQAQLDAYMILFYTQKEKPKYDLDKWMNICQYGLDRQYWQKKYEKNHTKFVYVKK